jgi:RNA polymerase subunit RPABC4/transcription elongation factor Spt4
LKVCPKCGKRFPDEYGFCNKCGSELGKEKSSTNGKTSRKVLVDGANALFGGGSKPKVKNLQLVIEKLNEEGYQHVTFVEARMVYRVDDRPTLEQMISRGIVRKIPARTDADLWILKYATDHPEYRVLSNDMFTDWEDKFPWVWGSNRFIRFMIINDEAYLEEVGGAPLPKSRPRIGKQPLKAPVRRMEEKGEEAVSKPKFKGEMKVRSCHNCGMEIPARAKFCPICGVRQSEGD